VAVLLTPHYLCVENVVKELGGVVVLWVLKEELLEEIAGLWRVVEV